MPFLCRPVTDERDALEASLGQQQDALRAAVHGLADEQAGQAPTASALSVGVILKHVAQVQRNWLAGVEAAPEMVARPSEQEQRAMWERVWTWHPGDTVPDVVATFDESCEAVLDAVRTRDLDTPFPVFDAPWAPRDVDAWSVRWVWFHLIQELARHAGHADIVREALDGAQAMPLLAAYESAAQD